MCGLIVTSGSVTKEELTRWIKNLHHRGPNSSNVNHRGSIGMAFSRLAINDLTELGDQPREFNEYSTMVNGEIYNHQQLKDKYQLQYSGNADTNILGPLFSKIGKDVINQLDGFYSAVIFNNISKKLYTLKDYIGKKGLFLVKKGTAFIITSELKAIPDIDSFQVIPKGMCEVNLSSGEIKKIAMQSVVDNAALRDLPEVLFDAVIKRIPKDNAAFGAFLSGGLDSSILASILVSLKANVTFYLLGDENSSIDFLPGVSVLKWLGITNYRIIPLPSNEELPLLIDQVVYCTESYNPSIISNGFCTYLLSRAANKDGLKVIFSGEGADELFGGYKYQKKEDEWKFFRSSLVDDMHFTELRRVDLTCMSNSVEARFPYLDREMYELSQRLQYEDLYSFYNEKTISKWILRKSYEDKLPEDIIWRQKVSSDVGSGLRKMVVNYLLSRHENEKEGLLNLWSQHYTYDHLDSYFHSYPCFDAVIENRGVSHKKKY